MRNETSYLMNVHGQHFTVFDIVSSQSIQMLDQDFIDRNPFELVKDPRVILDLGAHVGMFSFTAALKWPNAKVYAVEPHHQNIKNFILGLDMNRDIQNVTLLPVAVGNSKFVDLALELGNSGSSTSHPKSFRMFGDGWPMLATRSVAMPLWKIIEKVGHVDYLKCDIEGAEFDVFRDAEDCWRDIGAMWMEVHPFSVCDDMREAIELTEDFSAMLRDRMKGKPLQIIAPDFKKEIEQRKNKA